MSDFEKIADATNNFNKLPTGMYWNYYTNFPKFEEIAITQQNHVSKMISALLENQKILGNIKIRDGNHLFELIEKGNDVILDRVNRNIKTLNDAFESSGQSVIPTVGVSDSSDKSQVANT